MYTGISQTAFTVFSAATTTAHKDIVSTLTETSRLVEAGRYIRAATDSKDGVQALDIDQRVKGCYHYVHPKVVQSFYNRFHADSMISLEKISSQIEGLSVPPLQRLSRGLLIPALGGEKAFHASFQTISMGVVTWLADKIKQVIPDANTGARTHFAETVANNLESTTKVFSDIAADLRKRQCDWTDPDFVKKYQLKLSSSQLYQQTANKEDFYRKLAARFLVRVEAELPNHLETNIGNALKALGKGLPESDKIEQVTLLLLELDKILTDRTQIKKWLIQILDASNDSMEGTYYDFLAKISGANWWIPFSAFWDSQKTSKQPETTTAPDADHSKNYGKATTFL